MRKILLILILALLGCRSKSVKPDATIKESKVATRFVNRPERGRQPQQHIVSPMPVIKAPKASVAVTRTVNRSDSEIHPRQHVIIDEIMNKVVALNDGQVYCGGIWIKPTQFITAYHCIKHDGIYYNKRGSSRVSVGSLVKFSAEYDLALVETGDSDHPLATLAIGASNVGDKLHIIGHAMGLSWSYIDGSVSAYRNRVGSHYHGPYLQMSAPVYYGYSGGGVFNERGELIGVTSFIANIPNTAFAVYVENIRSFIN